MCTQLKRSGCNPRGQQLLLVVVIDLNNSLAGRSSSHLGGQPLDLLDDQVGVDEPVNRLQLDVTLSSQWRKSGLLTPSDNFHTLTSFLSCFCEATTGSESNLKLLVWTVFST